MLAQVVQVRDGNRSQARVLRPLVDLELALQNAPLSPGRSASRALRQPRPVTRCRPVCRVAGNAAADRPSPAPARWPCSARSAASSAPGSTRSSSRCSAAPGPAPPCPVGRTAVPPTPAPPSHRAAGGLRPQTGSPRCLRQTGQSPPNSTLLLEPCGCSLPSMTDPSGSSCIGIKVFLQAHLVLEESKI